MTDFTDNIENTDDDISGEPPKQPEDGSASSAPVIPPPAAMQEGYIPYADSPYNQFGQPRVNQYAVGSAPAISGGDIPTPAPAPLPQSRRRNKPFMVIIYLLALILAICMGISIGLLLSGRDSITETTPPIATDPEFHINIKDKPVGYDGSVSLGGSVINPSEVVSNIMPSVVIIEAYNLADASSETGSGVIISQDGYIITNYHIMSSISDPTIKVTLNDERSFIARIVGSDARTDIAVLKILADGLTPAALGNSDQLSAGEFVLAIGNPGGRQFSNTVTLGIVSATDRSLTMPDGYTSKFIQFDASVNTGNSGGPLVNMYGQVVGIVTSKLADSDYVGIAFAIKTTTIEPIIQNIISTGEAPERPLLGITYTQISQLQAEYYNLPVGLRITGIREGSSLANGDVQIGDIIVKADGVELTDKQELLDILETRKPGDSISLTVFRPDHGDGSTFDITAVLVSDSDIESEPTTAPSPPTTEPFTNSLS